MDYRALEKNLIDAVREGQLKLGASETPVSLYYPADSLNRLLGTQLSLEELGPALAGFCSHCRETLGNVGISAAGDRYCITVPLQGVRYVQNLPEESGFLRELIELLRNPHAPVEIDDVLRLFWKYSDQVCCIEADEDEFNYLVYFADGHPDDYRYLFELRGGHASYHRLTPGDWEALGITL